MTANTTLSFQRGDVVRRDEQPEWSWSVIGDHPLQYHWIYPGYDGYFNILHNVCIEKHGNAVILDIKKSTEN